jgi:predicted transglutaminase-like cysteine proteinase
MYCTKKKLRRLAALAGVALLFGTVAVEAAPHMRVTGRTSQPIGHYEYCKAYSADCAIVSSDTRPVALTRTRWAEIVAVNEQVNRQVKPVTDLEFYRREELWAYPDGYGDCEDYVLAKRSLLMQRGWPASGLLITVVRQANGEGHAVLTVRTDQADYVLDNLTNRILAWDQTDYRFLKRQAARHSGAWEGIEDDRNTLVGSVKR